MDAALTTDEVRRIARLARLQLTDEEVERYRCQLAEVLEHIGKLDELDVEGVEPLAHVNDETHAGRAVDENGAEVLDRAWLLSGAPDARLPYIAVPPTLDRGHNDRA